MNGWIKYYSDGSRYIGDRNSKNTTWRNSRNIGIVKVSLIHNNLIGSIVSTGSGWWQADQYSITVGSNRSLLEKTYIQKRVEPWNNTISISMDGMRSWIATFEDTTGSVVIPLSKEHRDTYFTIEIDIINNKMSYYFKNGCI